MMVVLVTKPDDPLFRSNYLSICLSPMKSSEAVYRPYCSSVPTWSIVYDQVHQTVMPIENCKPETNDLSSMLPTELNCIADWYCGIILCTVKVEPVPVVSEHSSMPIKSKPSSTSRV